MNTYFLLSLLLTAQLVLSSPACIALTLYLDECYVPDTVLVSVLINHVHNGSCIQTIQHHKFEEQLIGSGITLEAGLASKPSQHVASKFGVEEICCWDIKTPGVNDSWFPQISGVTHISVSIMCFFHTNRMIRNLQLRNQRRTIDKHLSWKLTFHRDQIKDQNGFC